MDALLAVVGAVPGGRPALPRRQLDSLTADVERRLLLRLAARVPSRITPDHLTALGLFAMGAAGFCYRLVPQSPLWILGVNAALFLNWLGDSLDGTLARHRQRQRPRYGFYADHLVDGLGAVALLGGLAVSGLATPGLVLGLLVLYLAQSVEMALSAATVGVHRIARAGVGGTELRMALALVNLVALAWPAVQVGDARILLLDIGGLAAALGLGVALGTSAIQNMRQLDREERCRWAGEPS